jgi:DNA polymerase I
MGVLPQQIPDFKALAGDPSDNIPGARKIGPKSAAALLLRYGNLDRVLEDDAQGLGVQSEQLLAFRDITRMKTDMPIELPESGPPKFETAAAKLRDLGANQLADRVAQRAAARLL